MTQQNENFQTQPPMSTRRSRSMPSRASQNQRGQIGSDWFENIQKVEQDLQDSILELEAAVEQVTDTESGQYDYHAVNSVKQGVDALKDARIQLLDAQKQLLSKQQAA